MAYAQHQVGSHFMVNTFGESHLYYMDKEIARSTEPTQQPIGTVDFKFLIRVNQNGTFDIQRGNDIVFNVTIEDSVKVCQVQVRADEVIIPPWYSAKGDMLTQKFTTRQTAEFNNDQFRVRLLNSALFRRVDFRFLQHSWFTMIVSNHQVMTMCTNATRELEILQWACADIIDQAKHRMPDIAVNKLGLSPRRVGTQRNDDARSVRSVASTHSIQSAANHQQNQQQNNPTAGASNENEMPSLVPSTRDNDAICESYIKQLELALAAMKVRGVKRANSAE